MLGSVWQATTYGGGLPKSNKRKGENMTPYQTFNKLCKGHNVTPSKVARETSLSQGTFTAWKQDKSKPKIENLCKIANYFGVPVTMFLDESQWNI